MFSRFRHVWICSTLSVAISMSTVHLFAAAPQPPDANVVSVVEGTNQFALDLYAKLGTASDGNLFFSPQSISTALSMTYAGARGDTSLQMGKALHLNLAPDDLASAQATLIKQLNDAGKNGLYQLSIANRLWGQQGYHFLEGFLKTLRDDYQADLEQLDFQTQPERARQTINDWVAQATQGKIKDLIPSGLLNEMTRLVLTNAVYFKGKWQQPFKPDATKPAPFFLSAGKQADVPMMYQKQRCRFGKFDLAGQAGLQVLELPYQGDELSMVVLLPNQKDGLSALEKQLTVENLKLWTTKLSLPEVKIWLPKFKLSAEFQLRDVLADLGMPLAFTPHRADFSGMDGQHDLYISAVVHKAYVDVNEEGTEAAAATGVAVGAMAMPANPPEFRADHPFLFLIRDKKTGCILFMGRMTDPR
jgi:serpin B